MDSAQQPEFREVTAETWSDFERLFDGRGGPKYCWCMVWRDMPASDRRSGSEAKKAAIRSIVESGTRVGIVACVEDEPIGWCSVAPRQTYRKGLGGLDVAGEMPGDVWSIACFYVPRRLRGTGMGRKLLHGAIEHARANGAKVIEAYPVDPDSPSYLFMGFVPMFREAGFEAVGKAGSRRHVMRLQL